MAVSRAQRVTMPTDEDEFEGEELRRGGPPAPDLAGTLMVLAQALPELLTEIRQLKAGQQHQSQALAPSYSQPPAIPAFYTDLQAQLTQASAQMGNAIGQLQGAKLVMERDWQIMERDRQMLEQQQQFSVQLLGFLERKDSFVEKVVGQAFAMGSAAMEVQDRELDRRAKEADHQRNTIRDLASRRGLVW